MLTYAFNILEQKEYKRCSTESFSNIENLLSNMILIGLGSLVKRGLYKSYITKDGSLRYVRGKIDLAQSIKKQSLVQHKLYCIYDEFSEDNIKNQIIKSTINVILGLDGVEKDTKKGLKNLLFYFKNVSDIKLKTINWRFNFDRSHKIYEMLIGICYLISKSLIQKNNGGQQSFMDFEDNQNMHKLYEKFILKYYQKHYPKLKAKAQEIKWAMPDTNDVALDQDRIKLNDVALPRMLSDVVLESDNKILIIDAKYYSKSTNIHFDKRTLISGHIYQIFTYVQNLQEHNKDKEVMGLILYANDSEDQNLNYTYTLCGNKICAKTLNLNCDFMQIKETLNLIAESFK